MRHRMHHPLIKRLLIDRQNIIHPPRMRRRKPLRPHMQAPQIRPIKSRIHIRIRHHIRRRQLRPRHDRRGRLVPQRQREVEVL